MTEWTAEFFFLFSYCGVSLTYFIRSNHKLHRFQSFYSRAIVSAKQILKARSSSAIIFWHLLWFLELKQLLGNKTSYLPFILHSFQQAQTKDHEWKFWTKSCKVPWTMVAIDQWCLAKFRISKSFVWRKVSFIFVEMSLRPLALLLCIIVL